MTVDWPCLSKTVLCIAGILFGVAAWMVILKGIAVIIDKLTGKWWLAAAFSVAYVIVSLALVVSYTEGCIVIGGR